MAVGTIRWETPEEPAPEPDAPTPDEGGGDEGDAGDEALA
jgi:hypothetical protein